LNDLADASDVALICAAQHSDPFSILGPHKLPSGEIAVRVYLPGAIEVNAIALESKRLVAKLKQTHQDGFFERTVPMPDGENSLGYRLRVKWADGNESIIHDPYRFGALLPELDIWLLSEGTHLRPYEALGAHEHTIDGITGTRFAVWAPNASRVSVVGDFNIWDERRYPMRLRRECGIWEIFLPDVSHGSLYKFSIRSYDGHLTHSKADPYARQSELRPATASVVAPLPPKLPISVIRQRANKLNAPISIYEVHLGSWKRKAHTNEWMNWDELSETLIPYAIDMGFTHLELLPIQEFPFDGSWGYQPVGLYSPTSRFGSAAGFAEFIAKCHDVGLGVLLDWVPAHFPSDAHGLANFDGTHLYDYADPREGFHNDWNTLIYNFGRTEVRNFLLGNSLYWLERFGVDGLRVDAVSSLLYRDYSREPGQWIPNVHGGRENLEAISLLQRMNEIIGTERPEAIAIAEESTAYPAVSRPSYAGGLGFHFKWNMGWMHDTLAYMGRDPIYRKHHHNELTFGLVYAFNENFVLPISHDEVVHGKGSLLNKMPGDHWQKFANLRAYLGFMFGHPGKKLLFMGCEFAQIQEWNHDHSLDWHLLEQPSSTEISPNLHRGVQSLVRDLNRLYRSTPALFEQDFVPQGFEWVELNDSENSVISFIRRATTDDGLVLVVCNFTPTTHTSFRVGVPNTGQYREVLNTDSIHYGGSNVGTPLGAADSQPVPWNNREQSILLTIPPLATVVLQWMN
jgi:1,4-alpha-glucan branching enzyme